MTLNDIYDRRYLLAKYGNPDQGFFVSEKTKIDYTYLDDITSPTLNEIYIFQLNNIRNLYPQKASLQELVKKLNLDRNVVITDKDEEAVEKGLSIIENALGLWHETSNLTSLGKTKKTISKDVANGLEVNLSYYEKMLIDLYKVYQLFSSSEFQDSDFINKRLEKIQQAMYAIAQDLKNYKEGTFVVHDIDENKGYLENAVNLGHDLKGRYLEIVGTNWFQEKMPSNIEVVNVGNVLGFTVDLFGDIKSSGKQLRTDIYAFDKNIAKTKIIKYSLNGKQKTTTVSEFIDDIKKGTDKNTITIPSDTENFKAIKESLVFGVQAKAGKGQAIFNKMKNAVTLNDVINKNLAGQYEKALNLLVSLITNEHAHIRQTNEHYQMMFNYILGRYLNNIIGQENDLVITRHGAQTLYNYFREEFFRSSRLVAGLDRINISMANTKRIDIGYTSRMF